MSSFIFLCSNETEKECLERLLFGTGSADHYSKYFSNVNIGDTLFLYNYDRNTIQGPFQAISYCRKDIEPNAWLNANYKGYPFQVKVDNSHTFQSYLSGSEIKKIVPFYGRFPSAKISEQIQSKLIEKLSQVNHVKSLDTYYKDNISSHFIFKCDRITGGKVFDDNVLGAPSELYQSVVGRVQAGDVLFVWLIEERKLYGTWLASSRGQYNPKEFYNYPAVVYCSRKTKHEIGLNEIQLRNILPFNSTHPPYKISYQQGIKILEELDRINNLLHEKETLPLGQYKSEDGHIVKSQGELIIDNWLYRNGINHAYEHRIQRDDIHLMTDFYLSHINVYVEYWGMISDATYRQRKEEKINFYRKHGLNLIELFPRDLSMLSEILKVKLAQYGVKLA